MENVNQPKLSDVAPLLNGIIVMFIWLNYLLSVAMFIQAPNRTLIIAGSYTMSYVWAGLFFTLASVQLWAKIRNKWVMLRNTLIAGLFIKAIFTYALLVLGLSVGFKGIMGVTSLWLAITWVQFFAVMTFKLPGGKYVK